MRGILWPSVRKPFIAYLLALQPLLVKHFMDFALNTAAVDLALGVVIPQEQMDRHKSWYISVASNCDYRLHFRKTNIENKLLYYGVTCLEQSYVNHVVLKASYPLVNRGLLSLTSVTMTNSSEVTVNVPSVALIRRVILLLSSRSRFPITVIFPDKSSMENVCAYSLENE